ncbi:hypothetical protein QJQ45_004604 [Haematococcus lacustris]|nr:hypothetical protein QJQ45_004604 [Haematococcus lacustris]
MNKKSKGGTNNDDKGASWWPPCLVHSDLASALTALVPLAAGVPRDLYRPFPAITAFHTRMASVPQIRDMYQGVTEGLRMAFKTGAASAGCQVSYTIIVVPRALLHGPLGADGPIVADRGRRNVSPCCNSLSSLQPGKAEVTRVLLNVGKIPFGDYIISREQWAELKPTMPYGQVPVLEVDGKQLAQSSAIERYAARLAGLYPQDAWEAAKVDELACFMSEWLEDCVRTFYIKDADEKLAARKAMVEGPLQTRMTKLNSLLTEAGPDGYLVGGRMTYADVAVYVMTSNIICGFLDGASWWHPCLVHSDLASALTALVPLAAGVPRDLYQPFPAITAFHTRMASVPQIRDMYQGVTDGLRMTFKAGAASA